MSPVSQLPITLRHYLTAAVDTVQLALLQRIIRANRLVRRGQLWIRPIQRWLWLMPASYLAGLIGGYLLLAH